MSSLSPLLDGYDLNGLRLPNRVVMAPMTRSRAPLQGRPTQMMAQYYAQRASAGLIITEATNVSPASAAFELTPGIITTEQIDGWRHITSQVHAAGGRIFMQLWHGGRVSSFALLGGEAPLSPSGVNDDLEQLQVWAQLQNGQYTKIHATPSRAMSLDEVKLTIDAFKQGAVNAIAAGFDGVEVHAANGYLPHQFLSSTTNTRDDRYGGSIANRANFLRDILTEIGSVVSLDRVGVRVSPYAHYNNVRDADPDGTYDYVGKMLGEFGVAYLHAADTNGWSGAPDLPRIIERMRRAFPGTLMLNGGIAIDQADALIRDGHADLVAFARAYIANPDLVERIATHAPLASPKAVGWYGGDHTGYIDYPFDSSAGQAAQPGTAHA
ncbi:alkene reductase [Paraburkholderia fungorum]|uniref:alkene reductase n=1 Tax=Paraburkholderia fungorum TaxID=134537 RepID=UPI00248EBD8A|nr:alkene reductase [Paraburkholderia fungorum]